MNKIIKLVAKETFTEDGYNDLQTNYRQAIINKNKKREEKLIKEKELKAIKEEKLAKAEVLKKEKLLKAEEVKKEKLAKKLETKKENKSKAKAKEKINTFHENFREIMVEHSIYTGEDDTITPFNIQLLNAGGAKGISCDLAFPKGLSTANLDKATKSLSQNVFGKCMVFIEDEYDKDIKFSAIKTWHDIKYVPYLNHEGKKLTASQLFCGYDIRLKPIVIDMAKDPHLMITGGTGGGKSRLVEIMLANLAAASTPEELNLFVLQLVKDDNFKFELLEHCKGCVTSDSTDNKKDTLRKALAMLRHIDKELSLRGSLVKNRLGRKSEDINIHIYNEKFPDEKLPVIQLWVDEASSLYDKSTDKEMNKMLTECQSIVERVATSGRYIGVYLVNILQRASKEEMPRLIKTNTMNWISFRQVDAGASKVAIGDETSALGLPQRVFVFKAGSDTISFAKTPFTRWDTNVKYLEKQNKIREDKQEVYDAAYSFWWNESIDRNKNSINQAKQNSKGNIIENTALKISDNKISELTEMISELEYERNQQAETISELLRKNTEILNKLTEQNMVVGRMVKQSTTSEEVEEQTPIDINKLTQMKYSNVEKQREHIIEEVKKSDAESSPYKSLDLSGIKLNKKG